MERKKKSFPELVRTHFQSSPVKAQPRLQGQEESDEDEDEREGCQCPGNKFWWYDPPQDLLPSLFCRDTSLHGLKYVGQPRRHLTERLFWITAFTAGVVTSGILIHGVWSKFNSSPVIVSFRETELHVHQIPFPALTICNVNNVLQSKAHEYIRIARERPSEEEYLQSLQDLRSTDHICTAAGRSFSQKFNFMAEDSSVPQDLLVIANQSIGLGHNKPSSGIPDSDQLKEFLQKAAQPCDKMLLLCRFEDRSFDCSQFFQPIETDFGKCCTFNMVPQSLLYRFENDSRDNPDVVESWRNAVKSLSSLLIPDGEDQIKSPSSQPPFPRRVRVAGRSYGLSILLDPELQEYFCTTADSAGFQLLAHNPLEVPHVVDYGMGVEPNTETFIEITPDVTTVEPSVQNIDISKRSCYFPGEYKLHYFQFYTIGNCIEECGANLTFDKCKCVRYYMPNDYNRSLCGTHLFPCSVRKLCSTEEFVNLGYRSQCSDCLPTCTEIVYSSQVTSSHIRSDVKIWNFQSGGQSPEWAADNVSIVHVYFGSDSFYPKIRKVLYGWTELLANTGGLLGLCLGLSALSLVELIYFLTLRAWCRTRRERRVLTKVIQKLTRLWKRTPLDRNGNGRGIPTLTQGHHHHPFNSNSNGLPQVQVGFIDTQNKFKYPIPFIPSAVPPQTRSRSLMDKFRFPPCGADPYSNVSRFVIQ